MLLRTKKNEKEKKSSVMHGNRAKLIRKTEQFCLMQ